jgi:hypothetical protein
VAVPTVPRAHFIVGYTRVTGHFAKLMLALFDLNCMLHNVMRGIYLLKEQRCWA